MGGRDIEALEYVWGMIVHYEGRDGKLDDKSRRKRGRNGMTTLKVSHGGDGAMFIVAGRHYTY